LVRTPSTIFTRIHPSLDVLMKSFDSNRHSLFAGLCALSAVVVALVALAGGCETGGKEGDRCNPLVLQDECNARLHCQAATCSESYCCRTDGTSGDPHCQAAGCPDPDAGEEGGSDAAEAGAAETGAATTDAATTDAAATD
jgi:hypothetical protein